MCGTSVMQILEIEDLLNGLGHCIDLSAPRGWAEARYLHALEKMMTSLPESDQVILSSRVEAIYKEEVAKLGRSPEVLGGKPMRAWEHHEVVHRVGVLDAAVPKGPKEG